MTGSNLQPVVELAGIHPARAQEMQPTHKVQMSHRGEPSERVRLDQN